LEDEITLICLTRWLRSWKRHTGDGGLMIVLMVFATCYGVIMQLAVLGSASARPAGGRSPREQ
jgi:hypothetical protein